MNNKKEIEKRVKLAKKLALEAGKYLLHKSKPDEGVKIKKNAGFVSKADKKAQEIILKEIRKQFPEDLIIAEEKKNQYKTGNKNQFLWLVDPLDGTTNYINGLCFYCVSIGIMLGDTIVAGIIYAPALNELFVAIKGQGATLNNKKIKVSQKRDVKKAFLVTGFCYKQGSHLTKELSGFYKLSIKVGGVRRLGSAAIDLCYVAKGVFDGFWERGLSPWDVAAGILIVEEAGGICSDFKGNKSTPFDLHILTSNKNLHIPLLNVLKKDV